MLTYRSLIEAANSDPRFLDQPVLLAVGEDEDLVYLRARQTTEKSHPDLGTPHMYLTAAPLKIKLKNKTKNVSRNVYHVNV